MASVGAGVDATGSWVPTGSTVACCKLGNMTSAEGEATGAGEQAEAKTMINKPRSNFDMTLDSFPGILDNIGASIITPNLVQL